jgi:hypothetical protein
MITLPSREEIRRIVQSGGDFRGRAALSCPTLEEVQAAIDAGRNAELQLVILSKPSLASVTVYAGHATIREKVYFDTLKLTFVKDLKVDDDGSFSFVGEVRRYQNDWHEHLGETVRSYSTECYRITYDPGLILWCVYNKFGSGHGTEFQDESSS